MQKSPVLMADGVAQDARAIRARFGPHMPVALPVDGAYAWSLFDEDLVARKIRYSVMAGSPTVAKIARVKDVEARIRVGGDAGPADVPDFLNYRLHEYGHDDGTVYSSLTTVPAVIQVCDAHDVHIPRWWLAWYWQQPGEPTREQVLAELERLTGIVLDPETLWGCQYASYGQWDLSVIYGEQDFSR